MDKIINNISTIIIALGGIGLLIQAIRKKPRDEKNDIINSATTQMEFWQKQAEGEKLIRREREEAHNQKIAELTEKFTTQINALTREVGELKGQLNAEKNQNERLEKIFQNRDPETKEFMKFMVGAQKNHDETHSEIIRVLGEIHTYVKQEHDRELHIDATITKDGVK